jgi:hypothetical protein
MADFGGVVRFTFGGSPLVMRGKLTTEPASVKATSITNQDGSASRSLEPKGYVAEVTFEDSTDGLATPQPWDKIIKGGPYNITAIEEQTNVVHTWTQANFIGDAKVDRMNGEVTGLSIHCGEGGYNTNTQS